MTGGCVGVKTFVSCPEATAHTYTYSARICVYVALLSPPFQDEYYVVVKNEYFFFFYRTTYF